MASGNLDCGTVAIGRGVCMRSKLRHLYRAACRGMPPVSDFTGGGLDSGGGGRSLAAKRHLRKLPKHPTLEGSTGKNAQNHGFNFGAIWEHKWTHNTVPLQEPT
eukprot:5263119-Amphidinium_carterae.1